MKTSYNFGHNKNSLKNNESFCKSVNLINPQVSTISLTWTAHWKENYLWITT